MNTASIAGLQGFQSIPVYAATEHAIVGFARSYGTPEHYKRFPVRILTICPGVTATTAVSKGLTSQFIGTYKGLYWEDFDPLPVQT